MSLGVISGLFLNHLGLFIIWAILRNNLGYIRVSYGVYVEGNLGYIWVSYGYMLGVRWGIFGCHMMYMLA